MSNIDTANNMNLLILTNKLERPSCRQRISVYVDLLKQHGINCSVMVFPSSFFKRFSLKKLCKNSDAVLIQKRRLRLLDSFWMPKCCKKIIYDLDDAVMFSDSRPDHNSLKRMCLFKRTVKTADMVIAGNQYLAQEALRFNRNVHVIPTGLDVKDYNGPFKRTDPDTIRLVWIGSRQTIKYLENIRPALEHIGKNHSNVVLRIICNVFFDLENMPVEKKPWSLQSQGYDLQTSDIGLAPLPDDRFTRGKCGFKILQYSAASLPTITSPVGVNSEYVTDGLTGFHASNDQQWIDAMEKLIENAEMRKKMASAARQFVCNFDISDLAPKIAKLLVDCVDNKITSDVSSPLGHQDKVASFES